MTEIVTATVDFTAHDLLMTLSPDGPLPGPILWSHWGGGSTYEIEPGRMRAIMRLVPTTIPGGGNFIAQAKAYGTPLVAEFQVFEAPQGGGGGGTGGAAQATMLSPQAVTIPKGAGFP